MFNQVAPDFLLPYLSEPDGRSSKWFLTNSYIYMIIAQLLYFLALKYGKQFMQNREPAQLKNVLLLYNAFQALFSLFIFLFVGISAYQLNYKLICQEKQFDIGAPGQRMAEGFWYFHLSKYIDMLDTLFFILRKKDNQISFLHCYHHSTMLITTYTVCVFYPGGHSFIVLLANSFVHVIMYSYYFLAALGPAIQKYLWWKRYLTQLQLIQFLIMILQIYPSIYLQCKGPLWISYFIASYVLTLIPLFLNFYIKSYSSTSTTDTKKVQ